MTISSNQVSHGTSMSPPKEIYNIRVYILAIVASMGAIMFGYDLAFIGTSLSLKSFQRDFGLDRLSQAQNDDFAANVVSLLQAGCFFGSLGAAPVSDKLGRRAGLMASALLYVTGSALQTWAYGSKGLMFGGRVVGGIGVGSASALVPLYVAECSPPAIRGRLVGIYEIGVQFGSTIGFWINYGVNENMPSNTRQWMVPFAFQLVPGGLLFIGMLLALESPRWVARHKGKEEAAMVLSRLRQISPDHGYLQEELAAIVTQIEEERLAQPGKGIKAEFSELFGHPLNRKRIFLGMSIFVFMQFAGSNAINYYSPRVFRSIGLQGESITLISTGIYGTIRFITVCIAMYFLVDRFGRVKLLLIGSTGMAICMYYLGGFVTAQPAGNTGTSHMSAASIVAAAFLYIYAVFYCISWAGIPWIYTSEIFPTRVRSLAVSICTAVHWIFNFVIARSVPYMISDIGGGTYFLFAACLTVSVLFVWFWLPETSGRNLEDMDNLFVTIRRTRLGRPIGALQEPENLEIVHPDLRKPSVSEVDNV